MPAGINYLAGTGMGSHYPCPSCPTAIPTHMAQCQHMQTGAGIVTSAAKGACSHKIGRETTVDCPISNHWPGVAYGLETTLADLHHFIRFKGGQRSSVLEARGEGGESVSRRKKKQELKI
ncbi:hypothetical protein OsI_08693 [Oryza sativa Indica Group]|uniref:Uncharacterized protein n=1 Tax=Oryza sativa subsp. indica TaxID=39946 RepID=B8AHM0_ORYSI|nr:hypothetical protein OsI_08693 [Oryza sativa Indica Group]